MSTLLASSSPGALCETVHPLGQGTDPAYTSGLPRVCVTVAGVAFDDITMPEAVQKIAWMAEQTDHARHVCTGNLDHLALIQNDPEFQQAYQAADLVIADGMPVVWLSRLGRQQRRLRERVAGSDLFWELGRLSEQSGLRLFFLGGVPGSAYQAANAVRKRFPLARIAGTYCPPMESFGSPEEEARITEEINLARPDILLVALGAPKQEKWILRNKQRLGIPVSIGVGGSFEFASGMQRRAPIWMQRAGLEWLFRLGQDPRRLANRYLKRDLPFLAHLLVHRAYAPLQPGKGQIP